METVQQMRMLTVLEQVNGPRNANPMVTFFFSPHLYIKMVDNLISLRNCSGYRGILMELKAAFNDFYSFWHIAS